MIKCETCIYRKNCQFLAKHKKVEVIGCDAFVSEIELVTKIKWETVREFAKRLRDKACNHLVEYDEGGWSDKVSAVKIDEIDDLVKEMTGGD